MFSYHRGIGDVFAIGESSSSSNNVDSGRGIEINKGTRMPSNCRTSSPSFRPYINQFVHVPPP
ncbi:hypothetical protein PIB30_048009, partial [Stylosanthes scabra]|nr:hypothetical protein [Stylosanthes scabra]